MTLRNPFRRRLFVTLHFSSGAAHTIKCDEFTSSRRRDSNALAGIEMDGELPNYVRLDAIEFISIRRGWFA